MASASRTVWTRLGVVAAATALLLVWLLPLASGALERRLVVWLASLENEEESGFSSSMRLGSTTRMKKGDRIVLRTSGAEVDLLRGAVFDRYDARGWSTTMTRRTVVPALLPEADADTKVVFARGARIVRGREARWFSPSSACDPGTASGKVAVDDAGLLRPEPALSYDEIWFRTRGACRSPLPAAAPPGENDVEVDDRLRAELGPVARDWTAGAVSDAARLDAIAARLGAFGYSLDVRLDPRRDPVVDFLLRRREGHCELFASSMVLLARTLGIPSRVVAGYRGGESNRSFGYRVVRERNAHAWVEAWVDGRWQTFDPTPVVEDMHGAASRVDDAWDGAAFALDRALSFVARITLLEWGVVLACAAAVLGLVREVSSRLGKRRRGLRRGGDDRDALPAFDALSRALAARGHERPPAEPIEDFARRVAAVHEDWASSVEDALLRYAALRYGGRGSERDVTDALERAARTILGRVT